LALRVMCEVEVLSYYLLAMSPKQIAERFGASIRPLFTRAAATAREARALASLRDVLLPKLISGEIRVRDAQVLGKTALAEAG
jgi:type I restriction enzyme S subunit